MVTGEPIREESLVAHFRKGTAGKESSKNKGKGLLAGNGLKVSKKVLKLDNNFASTIRLMKNPFDDGAKIGSRLMDTSMGHFQFQAVRHGLDKEKNMAVRIVTNTGSSSGEKQTGIQMETLQKGTIREVFGQRPTNENDVPSSSLDG